MIAQWAGRFQREFPDTKQLGTRAAIEMALNIFRDESFVPVFGIPYDQTTREWRGKTYQESFLPCNRLRDNPVVAQSGPVGPMLGGPFDYSSGVDPQQIFQILPRFRKLRQDLDAMLAMPPPETVEGYQEAQAQLRRLTDFSSLWPSEIEEAKQKLTERRTMIARRAVGPWETQLTALPPTLASGKQIHYQLGRNRELLEALGPEGSEITARLTLRADAAFNDTIAEKSASLARLKSTDGDIRAWYAWKRDFDDAFADVRRPSIEAARATGEARFRSMLDERLPSWRQEIMALPLSAAGLQKARERYADFFRGNPMPNLPVVRRYQGAVNEFVNSALTRLEDTVRRDPAVPAAAKAWYISLVQAKPVKGVELIRAVRAVRLIFDTAGVEPRLWQSLPIAQVRQEIVKELTSLGLVVSPNAEAELYVKTDGRLDAVTSTYRYQTERTKVWSVWGQAKLSVPATVARSRGFFRTRVVLAATVAGEVTIGETLNPAIVRSVVDQVIRNLPLDADDRTSLPTADSVWRETMLSGLPQITSAYADFQKTVIATGNGRRLSMAGVSSLGRLQHGTSGLNQLVGLAMILRHMKGFFDPSAAWDREITRLGWSMSGAETAPTPIHQISAYLKVIHEVVGPRTSAGAQVTSMVIRMDQAAIRESNCILALPGGSYRSGCLSAQEASLVAGLNDDTTPDRSPETVRRLVDSIVTSLK